MVAYERLKTMRKFQPFGSKSGRLPKRFQTIVIWLETFGILDNWSLRRGVCLQEVLATGVSAALQNGKNSETVTEKLKVLSMLMCYIVKQLPFSLIYLLFRQTDCLYCKCGNLRYTTILLNFSLHTSQAAHQDCGYIWFISPHPPPPRQDGSPSQDTPIG